MHRYDRPRRTLALLLAALAGFIDATGFLSADSYFVSFMSGNTTRLAVDLVARPASAIMPALLITGFVCGVIGGAVIGQRAGVHRKPAVLGAVGLALLIAAGCGALDRPVAMMVAVVLAMGAINNTFQRGGEVAVGLTYMTGALVRLGQGLAARLSGVPGPPWGANLLLWASLAGGALLGAAVWQSLPGASLWLAGIVALMLALLARRLT